MIFYVQDSKLNYSFTATNEDVLGDLEGKVPARIWNPQFYKTKEGDFIVLTQKDGAYTFSAINENILGGLNGKVSVSKPEVLRISKGNLIFAVSKNRESNYSLFHQKGVF